MSSSRFGYSIFHWRALLALSGVLFSLPVAWSKPSPGAPQPYPAVFRKTIPTSLEDLTAIEKHVQDLIKRVSPAVVSVRVKSSIGSGVVISKDGLVLCAAHVCGVPGQEVIFTFPDGTKALGETLGTNHRIDSGLMKIKDPGPWPHVEVGSPDETRVGDWVLALGHPDGFDDDRPVVARLGRVISQMVFLQTDCTLISGDSGGPLFNVQGHVVGIHSRISASTTDNYHVPIKTYLDTWERLEKGENWGTEPARSTIGVRAVDDPEGCRLASVREAGPGAVAGLKPGDIVVGVNGVLITDADSLRFTISEMEPGSDAVLLVKRGGDPLSITVKVTTAGDRNSRRSR